VFVKAR